MIEILEPQGPVTVGSNVKFKVRVDGALNVNIVADHEFDLGPVKKSAGDSIFTLERIFSKAGKRTITVSGNGESKDFTLNIKNQGPSLEMRQGIVRTATSLLPPRDPQAFVHREVERATGIPPTSNWCVAFCNYVYKTATGTNPPWGLSEFFVPTMVAKAKDSGLWIREHDIFDTGIQRGDPQPGDLLIYGDGIDIAIRQCYPHIGVVVEVFDDTITTIEGNTGIDDPLLSQVLKRFPSRQATLSQGSPKHRYIAGYFRLGGDE